jgi:hypothetical protein
MPGNRFFNFKYTIAKTIPAISTNKQTIDNRLLIKDILGRLFFTGVPKTEYLLTSDLFPIDNAHIRTPNVEIPDFDLTTIFQLDSLS